MLWLFLIFNAFSQVPNGIRYQGVAHNSLGQVLSQQQISVRFSIIQDTAPSNLVYSEIHHVQTNGFGLFSVIIGKGIPLGDFASIDWSKEISSLRIEMDINNGVNFSLMGENQLLTVPYAFAAGNVSGPLAGWKCRHHKQP